MPWLRRIAALVALTLCLLPAARARAQNTTDWTEPVPPFRIAGNLYYAGSKGLASYLANSAARRWSRT
jgi:metallo-beta-lactamase class B